MTEYEKLSRLNQPFHIEFLNSFENLLQSGFYVLGEQLKKFESNFASYCGSSYCIGVASGTDALTISMKAFSFSSQSEIIVPSNTYIATIFSILNCNLKPVLVEPDIHTYNIDPARIEAAITRNTVAIMAVHLYGKCCAMDRITQIAEKYNLKLIEDCAQAHGARFKGKMAGTFGHFGAFSFYPTKNLGALGDGGCLITDSQDLAKITSMYRNYGSEKKHYNEIIGINSRLDEIQAGFLDVKLKYLDSINAHKRKIAFLYNSELKQDFVKPTVHDDYHDVYHIYTVRHPRRDSLRDYLMSRGIKTEIHYPVAPHRQKALSGMLAHYNYPVSEEIHATTLSLPISPIHSEEEISKVIEVMNKF